MAFLQDAKHVRGFVEQLSDAGLAARTQARKLSAIRQFQRFLMLEGLRDNDPTSTVDAPRLGRPLPKVLGFAEVDTLLAAAREVDGWRGARLGALLEILYAHGAACVRTGQSESIVFVPRWPHRHRARQGRQGTPGSARRDRARRVADMAAVPRNDAEGPRCVRALAVPVARRRRTRQPRRVRQTASRPGGIRWH